MSKRAGVAVALIMGTLLLQGTLPSRAQTTQAVSVQSRYMRGARLRARLSGPVTVTLQGDSGQAFETLAAAGGAQVIFDRRFVTAPLSRDIVLNGVDLAAGFDELARIAGVFWETYDGKTVLVAPDDAGIRRQVEAQLFKPIALPAGVDASRTAGIVSTQFKLMAVSTPGNFLLLRDTPENVAVAENVITAAGGSLGAPAGQTDGAGFLTDLAGNMFTPEGPGLRKIVAPSHARLKPTSGPITARVQGPSRDAFQTLADRAGVQLLFHRQFQNAPIVRPLTFDGVDFLTAMDLLSFSTGNFWLALDERTIVVATDNPTVRRDVEPMTIKVFNLKNVSRAPEITEIITAWRTLLAVNQISIGTPQKVVLLRDTEEKIAVAERILAEFDRGPGSANSRLAEFAQDPAFPSGIFANPVDADERRAVLARLQPKQAGPFSIQMNQQARQAFETVAARAGIQVVFHRQFQSGVAFPFAIKDAELGVALDQLSFLTGNFWTVADPHTIVVATDNPTVRREVEQMVIRTVPTRNMASQSELTESVTALRTLLSFNQIALSTPQNTLLLRDNAHKIALAEKLMAIFDRPRSGPTTGLPGRISGGLSMPSGVFAQPRDEDATRNMRKQLQTKVMPASITFSQQSRQAFETLASMAGVQIAFHRQFANAAAFPFICEGCDFSTAMDRLSFQTGNFWIVTGANTIVVATDNPTVRREAEDVIVKAVYFANGRTSQQITEAITALRTTLSFNQIAMSTAANAIVLRDTADKIGLAEKIVGVFDPQATFSAPISSGAFAVPMDRDARRTRLALQLQLSSPGPFTARFNQSSRDAFATVAGLAGISAEFHPQFANAAPFAFQVDGVDWITAVDTLAFQTGTFWMPRDRQTILVATDNPTVRRDAIPEETRTIQWRNIDSPATATEVTTMLRTLVSVREIQPAGPKEVTMVGVPDVIALSERIVALVDIAGRVPTVGSPAAPRNSPTNGPQPVPGGAVPAFGRNPSPPPNFVPPPAGAAAGRNPIDFFTVLEPGIGSIAGQVRLNDGSPAAGVRVSAVSLPSARVESIAAKGETDASGRFKLDNVPSGRYALRVDTPLFPYPTYFPSAVSAQEGEIVIVSARSAVEGLILSTSDVLPAGRFSCIENVSCFDLQRRIIAEGVLKQYFVQDPALKAVLTIKGELGPIDLDIFGLNAAAIQEKGFSQVKTGDSVKVILNPRRDSGPGVFLAGFVKPDGTEVNFGVPRGAAAAADASGETIRINFQPAGAPSPAGYLIDTGAIFGDRGNGYRYGWAQQNSIAQDRKSAMAPDRRYDTLAHLQLNNSDHVWELEVPNGFYSVRVVAGDPSFFNSFHLLNVEGAIAVSKFASPENRWSEDNVRVAVNDGRLTISNASGSCGNKLAFIEVTPVTWGPEAAAAPAAPPFSSEKLPAALEGRGGVIAGVIRTPAGAPVPGVRVASMSLEASTGVSTLFGIAQTDEAGRYLLEDIPNGSYYVIAGSVGMPLYHPGVNTSSAATVVTMSGKPVAGVNFSADPARFSFVCSAGNGPKR